MQDQKNLRKIRMKQSFISDSLSVPLNKIYRFVTLASALMLIGAIAMIFANFYKSTVSSYFFGVGAILRLICLGFFI